MLWDGLYYNNRMIKLNIPGRDLVRLEHLVCDVNGTLAVDGNLIEGVDLALNRLRDKLAIHLLTADTYGRQHIIDQQLHLTAVRMHLYENTLGDLDNEAHQKADFVQQLGAEQVVAIGQGANDALMLKCAKIGICVMSPEGLAVEALREADVLALDILSALELLENPTRLTATLRI